MHWPSGNELNNLEAVGDEPEFLDKAKFAVDMLYAVGPDLASEYSAVLHLAPRCT